MKINLENLFYMVQEHFENTQRYHKRRLECWEKQHGDLRTIGVTPKNYPLHVDRLKGTDAHEFTQAYERTESVERAMGDFCNILGIDRQKLYHLVRAIIKWHDRRDWQVSFPFTDRNNKVILEYLQK